MDIFVMSSCKVLPFSLGPLGRIDERLAMWKLPESVQNTLREHWKGELVLEPSANEAAAGVSVRNLLHAKVWDGLSKRLKSQVW